MKLLFDPHQPHQADALHAVLDLFAGQPRCDMAIEPLPGREANPLGLANRLALGPEALLENLRAIQTRHGLPEAEALDGMHFSIEMETGTGKTYAYLRTIHELHARFGFAKFIIVVPSVAIREGVLKSLELTREHFETLYGRTPMEAWVYDAAKTSRLRGFAESAGLQVMVLNIDAFNKQANVIHKAQDRLAGRKPVEFIQAARPIVIVDEPQNMESPQAREAIADLAPLLTLRYSATHRHSYNLLYRLDPVSAYEMRLVKRIEVASVVEEEDFNRPYLRLEAINAKGAAITARLTLDVETARGPARKTLTVKAGDDLQARAGGREGYAGLVVAELHAGQGTVRFTNGLTLAVGQALGGDMDAVMQAQIRETVREHLDKELALRTQLPAGRRMKVLSLFFIDRVANYAAEDGKIRRWFESAYTEAARMPRYRGLALPPLAAVHDGYFATDKGAAKDTSGRTRADDEAYALIMRDKERLLSPDEPLRFIFSHSALREGWDNPNVFQICTLNETRSEIKKRQEIGRGLRLAVLDSGERCLDPVVNRLTVVANERYDAFCRALQTEIQEAFGVSFEGRVANRADRRTAALRPGWREDPAFVALWRALAPKTIWRVAFDTEDLIARAAGAIARIPAVTAPRLVAQKAALSLGRGRLEAVALAETAVAEASAPEIPDMLRHLQRETGLTRQTLAAMLLRSGRLDEAPRNPQQFLDRARAAIKRELAAVMAEGARYEPTGEAHDPGLFETRRLELDARRMTPVTRGLHDLAGWRDEAERALVEGLEARADVRLFFRLPSWYEIETPSGPETGAWAVMTDAGPRILDPSPSETRRRALAAHFAALSIPYEAPDAP